MAKEETPDTMDAPNKEDVEHPEPAKGDESTERRNPTLNASPALEVPNGQTVLGDASSDVVIVSTEPIDPRGTPPPLKPAEVSVASPNVQKDIHLYIEKSKGFYKANRRQVEQISAAASGAATSPFQADEDGGQIDCAGAVQATFSLVVYFLHGLLAGFSVFHCFFIFSNVQESHVNSRFVFFYSPLAMTIHALYFGVGAVCTIAAMDRYDLFQCIELLLLGRLPFWRLFFHSTMVCLYLLILALGLSTLSIDEQIAALSYNSTWITFTEWSTHNTNQTFSVRDIVIWKYHNLTRTLLLCFTWLFVQFGPDLLASALKKRGQQTFTEPSGNLPMRVHEGEKNDDSSPKPPKET
uniref:Transmembrane protein n=1 Tax=Trichuris muris TaxID=70415 RepID=A0A5S6QPK1_TRIMR